MGCTTPKENRYSIPIVPWEEELGNHRAVLDVKATGDACELNILWHRHDRNPEAKRFIIIHESGDTIQNIKRIQVNNERCQLVFGPIEESGKYFFYYLPYEVQENYGFYNKDYLKPENSPNKDWLNKMESLSDIPKVEIEQFQSRTEFDSFYPMEVIALQSEKDSLLNVFKSDFLVFPEDRRLPIRMLDEIPQQWIESGPSDGF